MRFLILAVVYFSLNITLYAQSFSMKGQFWSSALTNNDVPNDQSSIESTLGYIPTLSLFKNLSASQFIDVEWAYRFDRSYSADSLFNNHENHHRLWIRYSSEKIEARLGLQKIVFGPSQILRTLSWFDTIDLKDPTGQTDGVEAFRLRVFPSNSLSIWSWLINSNQDTISFGGRAELSTGFGEWGLTYHQDPTVTPQAAGQFPVIILGPHQRIALDLRYDGFIGSWMEGAFIFSDNSEIKMVTMGADYTLPIASGILIMTESLTIDQKQNGSNTSQTYSAFMASIPLGMIHQIMLISQLDWDENRAYNYLRWSATYDHYSLNLILSLSPKRSEYNFTEEYLPKTLAGFGTGLQFMFIYNH